MLNENITYMCFCRQAKAILYLRFSCLADGIKNVLMTHDRENQNPHCI